MVNRIKKEVWRSMNATPTRTNNKNYRSGAQEDPKQNKRGLKAKHGHDNHVIIHKRK
jgi:hypothetical protein